MPEKKCTDSNTTIAYVFFSFERFSFVAKTFRLAISYFTYKIRFSRNIFLLLRASICVYFNAVGFILFVLTSSLHLIKEYSKCVCVYVCGTNGFIIFVVVVSSQIHLTTYFKVVLLSFLLFLYFFFNSLIIVALLLS